MSNFEAYVFDIDDTVLNRKEPARDLGLITGKLRPQHLPNLSLQEIGILELNHARVAGLLNGTFEQISFANHANRQVFPWARRWLEQIANDGGHIFGNTGRSNTAPWVDMTEATFLREGISDFFMDHAEDKMQLGAHNGVFYTPEGAKTAISKAHALLQLVEVFDHVEFYEDDPRTIRFLAPRFPKVHFNYIQHEKTGLLVSKAEIDAFPNVSRLVVLQAA